MSVVDRVDDRGSQRGERPVRYDLAMSAELNGLLTGLASDLNLPIEKTFILAVALLRAAVDAKHEGKAVGVASSKDVLDAEFVGF